MRPSRDRLEDLAHRAHEAWSDAVAADRTVVVDPSMPILYFGDFHAYLSSSPRIVTVG